MTAYAHHEQHMRRALELARRGVGLVSPNPAVGALLVNDAGGIVGEGFHTYSGMKHAEVLAIEAAGKSAAGATLYLNLEPCSHQGRTGPCADAVIAAGIKRVVAAMRDPNPAVSGQGFDRLREAGIEVVEGVLEAEARQMNDWFAKFIRTGQPLVTLKAGMTLDGKIAPPPGTSDNPTALGAAAATGGWITSEQARAHVQELRHQNDAILVGVGTIVADDPLLTDRTGLPRRRPLQRVIMDSRLRLPLESRVVKSNNQDVIVLCSFAEERRKRQLEERGIRVEQVRRPAEPMGLVPTAADPRQPVRRTGTGKVIKANATQNLDLRPDMRAVMTLLGKLGITSILIEGGAMVNWAALSSGVVDKVFLYYAPKILAGTGAVPFVGGEGFLHMHQAAHVKNIHLHRFGEDFAVEGYIRDPYESSG
jgi:diaminohydroxyphosphoribosylaminopyrimidine deaminase / 5-amino-6-(5-phosphoribosylamino)uracil reductase